MRLTSYFDISYSYCKFYFQSFPIWAFVISLLLTFSPRNGHTQTCLPGGYLFYDQEHVDHFLANYPDCTEILGDVKISTILPNIDFMSQITAVHGTLSIDNSYNILNLNGLTNLTEVGENLIIDYNFDLTSLSGLEQLEHIGGSLFIVDCPSLENINGLQNLSIVGNTLSVGINPNLSSLSGLDQLSIVYGDLTIGLNNIIPNLQGLDQLQSIHGHFLITGNDSLKNFTGLEQLSNIDDGFEVFGNASLLNFEGLTSLQKIDSSFQVRANNKMENFEGLENLKEISGEFLVSNNASLINLQGLNELRSIRNQFIIEQNTLLKDLGGLTALDASTFEFLEISYNRNLIDINALNNMENFKTLDEINIYGNSALSDCAIEQTCNMLATCHNINFSNNGPYCMTNLEVGSVCQSNSKLDFVYDCDLKVYPNPVDQYLTVNIEGRDAKGVEYEIFDQLGRRITSITVLHSDAIHELDLDYLYPGIYYLKLSSWKLIRVFRFVKK